MQPSTTSKPPTPETVELIRGDFYMDADNFVYVPEDGRGLPDGFVPHTKLRLYEAAIPIVVGDVHIYRDTDGPLVVVMGPDSPVTIYYENAVLVNKTVVKRSDFKKVPIAYVPREESDWPTDDSTKPAVPCPPETSPFKPFVYKEFLVYFDGTDFLVYGRYSGQRDTIHVTENSVEFEQQKRGIYSLNRRVTAADFKAIRVIVSSAA